MDLIGPFAESLGHVEQIPVPDLEAFCLIDTRVYSEPFFPKIAGSVQVIDKTEEPSSSKSSKLMKEKLGS